MSKHGLIISFSYQHDHFVHEIDSTLAACTRAVEEYQRIICALRSKRNTCTIVGRLPEELVEEIFWNCTSFRRGSIEIFPLSHVCQRWRDIALNSARLWTCIVATGHTNPELLQACFERSRDTSLDVQLTNEFFRSPSTTRRSNITPARVIYTYTPIRTKSAAMLKR